MAHVHQIRLYPVKGFDPVAVASARVLASGALENDRRWAMIDARERVVNGKNHAALHTLRAAFDPAPSDAQRAEIAARFGEPVTWRENTEMGFPDDTDAPGPTLVSTASLAAVAEWFGFDMEQARRRFRANIEIDGVEAFWEDRLYGATLRIGEVEVQAVYPCQRCVVPSRDALTGVQDAGFQKRFAELRKLHFPPAGNSAPFTHYYRFTVNTRIAASEAGKEIRAGDAVAF